MANTERVSEPLEMTSSLHDRMGIELLEATAERVVGTMPVEGNLQPYGLLHGGASGMHGSHHVPPQLTVLRMLRLSRRTATILDDADLADLADLATAGSSLLRSVITEHVRTTAT